MFCEKCGAKIQENSSFCESCGTPITTNDIKKSTAKINTLNTKANNKKPKLSNKAQIIIAVVAFVCIVGVNVFIFKGIFFGEKKVSNNIKAVDTTKDSNSKEEAKDDNDADSKADASNDKKEVKDENDNKNSDKKNETDKDEGNDKEEDKTEKKYIHKYELIQSNLNWEEAKKYCEKLGGYLATITSKEEEDKVLAIVNSSDVKVLWLGANDLKSKGNFKWINGDDFSYHNWAVNEPNNENGVEHYLVLYKVEENWLWNDGPINTNEYYKAENIGFVCEYEVEQED